MPDDGDAPFLRFTLSDTGCGIPAEFMPQLFQPFRQANSSFARDHDRLGMGLATVRKLADYMHAELRLESEAGQGARVSLQVPLAVPA